MLHKNNNLEGKHINTILKTYFVDNLGYILVKNHFKSLLTIFLVHLNALLSEYNGGLRVGKFLLGVPPPLSSDIVTTFALFLRVQLP